jgi:hypothetical protein
MIISYNDSGLPRLEMRHVMNNVRVDVTPTSSRYAPTPALDAVR